MRKELAQKESSRLTPALCWLPEKGACAHTHCFLFLGTSLLSVARTCAVLLLVPPTRFLSCKRGAQARGSRHRTRTARLHGDFWALKPRKWERGERAVCPKSWLAGRFLGSHTAPCSRKSCASSPQPEANPRPLLPAAVCPARPGPAGSGECRAVTPLCSYTILRCCPGRAHPFLRQPLPSQQMELLGMF